MGNKQDKPRSRSESDVVGNGLDSSQPSEGKKGRSKSSKSKGKGVKGSASADDVGAGPPRVRAKSCPGDPRQEAPGTTTLASNGGKVGENGGQQLEVKIYRSYSNLSDARHANFLPDPLDTSNIKVYRRSTASASTLQHSNRAASLPRGFGRSRSCATAPTSSTLGPELRHSAAGTRSSASALPGVELRSNTLPLNRASSLRNSTGSTLSYQPTSTGYKVNKEDFPDTATIRGKLKQFEKYFITSFYDQYSRLPSVTQLTSLALALLPLDSDDRGQPLIRPISLFEYLRDEHGDIPVDLPEDGRFVLCIPPALFPGMAHVRRTQAEVVTAHVLDEWTALSRDVVMCVAAEAAGEISRMFEYQVALLSSDMALQLVADHCAERSLSYIVPDPVNPTLARLDRNTITQGVVRGAQARTGSRSSSSVAPTSDTPKFISVIIGMKDLKWNVYEIFSRPGLRRDVMLTEEDIPSPDEDDRSPWTYHTTSSGPVTGTGGAGPVTSDHMVYGYRGQMIDWDFCEGTYRLNAGDERRFVEESEWRYDDFHRIYPPVKRLIGAKAMKKYCLEQARMGGHRDPVKLDQYMKDRAEGTDYSRDAIQVIYRPLERFLVPSNNSVNLSGVDMPPRTVTSPRRSAVTNNDNLNNNNNNIMEETDVNHTMERRRPTSAMSGQRGSGYTSPTTAHVLSPEEHGHRTSTASEREEAKYRPDSSLDARPRYMIRSDI